MYFGIENKEGGKTVTGFPALLPVVLWFLYFVLIEGHYGATIGHRIFNLRVLNFNRNEISFSQALKRHLLDIMDFIFYGFPAIIVIRNSEKHQRIGDMWAKTIVVDITDPEQYTVYSGTNSI